MLTCSGAMNISVPSALEHATTRQGQSQYWQRCALW